MQLKSIVVEGFEKEILGTHIIPSDDTSYASFITIHVSVVMCAKIDKSSIDHLFFVYRGL